MGERVWLSASLPAGFPTRDGIVRSCDRAGFNRNGVCIKAGGKPRYWVKYGRRSLIQSEGRTQAHVARVVNANPASVVRVPHVYLGFSRGRRGYIVMDFVLGATIAQRKSPSGSYDKNDIKAVAAAVQQLINIRMPANTTPGPVGGGLIGHDFFVESLSSIKYPSVAHLEAQMNEVLRLSKNTLRVDFQTETANGLVLCPSDPNDSNFIIDEEGNLWAIDFGHTAFLPPSFVSYSLTSSSDCFVQSIAALIICPPSANLPAMRAASGSLVIFNDNTLGAVQPSSGSITCKDGQPLSGVLDIGSPAKSPCLWGSAVVAIKPSTITHIHTHRQSAQRAHGSQALAQEPDSTSCSQAFPTAQAQGFSSL